MGDHAAITAARKRRSENTTELVKWTFGGQRNQNAASDRCTTPAVNVGQRYTARLKTIVNLRRCERIEMQSQIRLSIVGVRGRPMKDGEKTVHLSSRPPRRPAAPRQARSALVPRQENPSYRSCILLAGGSCTLKAA